ncbi:MAG: PqqD family protein [Bacteriovorax sp.]|nr:PqqD family protein [Bacteriovorax sp.]
MDQLKLFPVLTAEPIQEYSKNKPNYYIFNSRSNRGYMLDGFAANLCQRFDGAKSLEVIIQEFENEMDLRKDSYKKEIDTLLQDLHDNSLIEFLNSPKPTKEG